MLSIKVQKSGRVFDPNVIQNHVIETSNRRVLNYGLSVAQALTPVRTGEARDGWYVAGSDTISNDVSHVPYLEYGTRYIRPRRMAAQAAEKMAEHYSSEVLARVRSL